MKKRSYFYLVFVFAVVLLCLYPTRAEAKQNYLKAYKKILQKNKDMPYAEFIYFNNDNIPDLFVCDGNITHSFYEIYIYKNGKIKKIDGESRGDSVVYVPKKGIISTFLNSSMFHIDTGEYVVKYDNNIKPIVYFHYALFTKYKDKDGMCNLQIFSEYNGHKIINYKKPKIYFKNYEKILNNLDARVKKFTKGYETAGGESSRASCLKKINKMLAKSNNSNTSTTTNYNAGTDKSLDKAIKDIKKWYYNGTSLDEKITEKTQYGTTQYLFHNNEVVFIYNKKGNTERRYYFLNGELIKMIISINGKVIKTKNRPDSNNENDVNDINIAYDLYCLKSVCGH